MSSRKQLLLIIALVLWPRSFVGAEGQYYVLQFAGPGQFVELRETSRLASANREFTAETWVRWTAEAKSHELFGTFLPQGDSTASGWDVLLWRTGDNPYMMSVRYAGSEAQGGTSSSFGSGGAVSDVWHHVAVVLDRQRELAVFIDGKRLRRDAWRGGVDSERGSLRLGASPPAGAGFQGAIRAFRLSSVARYDEAFTPPEGYRFPKDPQAVVLLDFSRPRPNVVEDVSGQGHHGLLVGARWARVNPDGRITLDGGQPTGKPAATAPREPAIPPGKPLASRNAPVPTSRPDVVKPRGVSPTERTPGKATPAPEPASRPTEPLPREPLRETPASKPKVRTAVPDEAGQAVARAKVQAVLKEELAGATTASKKAALAGELRRLARDSDEDAANRYALFQEAGKSAVEALRFDLALEIADEVGDYFETDPWPLKLAALKDVLAKARKSQEREQLAEATLPLLDAAVAAEHFAAALAMHQLASGAVTRSTKTELRAAFRRRGEQIEARQQRWSLAQLARNRLQTEPENAKANLALGRFLCLDKGQWQEGLGFLAKGEDPPLKKAAEADVRQPSQAAEQVAVADLWWTAAQPAGGPEREQLLSRSLRWYRSAVPDLSGLEKVRVEKRIQQIEAEAAVTTRSRSPASGGAK